MAKYTIKRLLQSVITYVLTDAFVSNGLTQYTLWWAL